MGKITRGGLCAAIAAVLLALGLPAHAERPGGRDQVFEGERGRHMDRMREERLEEQRMRQERDQQMRDRQREGLAPAGQMDRSWREMSPDERRRARQELNNAARRIYGDN
ncbi:hypothetical protein [Niveibacterium sp. SC-1]|uniref:hypothetical protein n=1 Tax=Niveibacterium sp. SC-1 TaxID=3135646 RepID=UPI00311D8046